MLPNLSGLGLAEHVCVATEPESDLDIEPEPQSSVATDTGWDELPKELRMEILSHLKEPTAVAATTLNPQSMYAVTVKVLDPGRDAKRPNAVKKLAQLTLSVPEQLVDGLLPHEPLVVEIEVPCDLGYSNMGDCLRKKVQERLKKNNNVPTTVVENYFLMLPVPPPQFDYEDRLNDRLKIDTSYGNGLSPGNDVVTIEFDLRGAQRSDRSLSDEVIDLFVECAPRMFDMMLNKLEERYASVVNYERGLHSESDARVTQARYVLEQIGNFKATFLYAKWGYRASSNGPPSWRSTDFERV